MKTSLTLFIAFSMLSVVVMSQPIQNNNRKILPLRSNVPNKMSPVSPTGAETLSTESGMGQIIERNDNPVVTPQAIAIGVTTYDLQTNDASYNRIYNYNDTIGAIWNNSQSTPPFLDRGTGYSFYDGSLWNPSAPGPIDTIAFSNIDLGAGNTEYVVGHNRTNLTDDLILCKRSPAGSGNWNKTPIPPHPAGHFCLWSRMRVGGANGMSIHVIALTKPLGNGGTLCNGIDGALTYSRSQDGGATWNLVHVVLPLMDQAHYSSVMPDAYAIDVHGSTVVITQGSFYNDWVMWKSTDDGTTWNRTVIWAFPIPAYDQNTMITDVNSDGIADTVEFIDGSQAVLIDNNGIVHCWVGRMLVIQEPASPYMAYFPNTDGLYYWNENFLGAPPTILTSALDLNNDSVITITPDIATYQMSLTSMPSAGIDASNNIFVVYSSIKENTSNGAPSPQNYRNSYCMASPDNGTSWSIPVNLFDSDFDEIVYPSIARNVDTKIHVIFQQDGSPGTSFNGPAPVGPNDIVYYEEEPDSMFAGVQVIPLNYVGVTGTVYFDQNQNGNKDAGETGMAYYPMQLSGAITKETNSNGTYVFVTDTGSYTVNPIISSDWQITSDSSSYNVTLSSSPADSLDFGMYPVNPVFQVYSNITAGIPRCNNYIYYWLNYKNVGTDTTSGTIKFVKDSQLSFQNSIPVFNFASGDTFAWSFSNLQPFEQRQIRIYLGSSAVTFGDTVKNYEQVFFNNAASIGMHSDSITQGIVCSFDPNDKTVMPEGVDVAHYTLLTDTLIYTIRFQNTGNDTAFTVRLRDTLDANIDPASFHMIASSHPVQVTRNANGVMLFSFNNILLPDSATNGPESNGFVKYSVRPLPGTPAGTVVNNRAHIFFDYNTGIVTNTTYNTLVDVIGITENSHPEMEMLVYPNPFSNETTLIFSKVLNTPHQVVIRDISGREIQKWNHVIGNSLVIKSNGWSSGMYFCIVIDEIGKVVGVEKLVVE